MDKNPGEGDLVTANGVPWFKFHFDKAREEGASDDDIQEALRVGGTRHYG